MSYVFDYNDNEKILVTNKTVDYGSCSFKKNTEICDLKSAIICG